MNLTPVEPRRLAVVLFDGFQLLDVFGPVDLFGRFPEDLAIDFLGPTVGPVRSSQGVQAVATVAYESAPPPDIVLVPGGAGARQLVLDRTFCAWLGEWGSEARLVTSVCTGSAVLASAGLLDGYRATSNKRSFAWVRGQGPAVDWVPRARWVEDGNRWTSSGVAAGMDMAVALLATIVGADAAREAADAAELEIHPDSDWDPFAQRWGAV